MAKLEGDTRAARQLRQEILEPRQIAAEKRRQLKQDRAQLAGLVQRAEGREKARRPAESRISPRCRFHVAMFARAVSACLPAASSSSA